MNDTAQEPRDLKEVVKFAEKKFNQINPVGLNFSAEAEFCIQILQNNAFLMGVAQECPRSVVSALSQAAAIGLSFNPAKKECYLMSRNVKTGVKTEKGKDIWESRIYLEPSYMGLNNVATNTGSIGWVQARVVRANDKFVDTGVGQTPAHEYDAFGTNESRGEIVGAYCVAKSGDDYLTTIMNKETLDKIRGRSEAWKKALKIPGNEGKGGGTWLTDPEEMCKKAVMRNAFKTWPKTDKFARMEEAVHISNENEGFEPLVNNPEINESRADQKAYFDQLIEKSDAIGMFVFMASLDHGVQASLFNSFERGSIKKYKDIVRALQNNGRAQLVDCQLAVEDSTSNGDDLGVKEIIEDLPKEAVEWICENTDDETRQFIQECKVG